MFLKCCDLSIRPAAEPHRLWCRLACMDMESFLRFGIDVLRLVPLVLIFYIPSLLGVAILKERGEDYKIKAALMISAGFVVVVGMHLVVRSASFGETLQTVGVSVAQMAVALLLAAITVYKLAD